VRRLLHGARYMVRGAVFGRVPIPPRLYSATAPHQPSFHEFGKGTADLVRCQRVSERTGHEAEYSDVVKGASTGGGSYVLLSQDELDEIAPGLSPSLDIRHVADLGEVDPIYFSRAYFLRPGDDASKEATPCYGRHGAHWQGRDRQLRDAHQGVPGRVRADGDVLVLETQFFADEIRDPRWRSATCRAAWICLRGRCRWPAS
jgi:DNA end-binding protein Ku